MLTWLGVVFACVVFLALAVGLVVWAVDLAGWKGAVVVAAIYAALAFQIGHSTAQASPTPAFGATVIRPANNATLDQLRQLAVGFWADRDVTVPDGATYLIDRCDGCGAYNVATDIYVPVFDVTDVQAHPMWAQPARELCAKVVHEVGHAAGLGHAAAGVMGADPDHPSLAAIPWTCRVWARDRRARSLSAR